MNILGISAYYHDSAACVVRDGSILSAAQEERFTRIRHDAAFPRNAILSCLKQAQLELKDLDSVVFYDKPLLKFDRLLETYLAFSPRGFRSFLTAMPVWLKDKLYLKQTLLTELCSFGDMKKRDLPRLLFTEHHQAHAASAFFPSPFERAAVLCLDGVGEWATSSVWLGEGNRLSPIWEIAFPHSLGLLYSAFTYFCGFRVNSGEYKLMGLAPYGRPRFVDTILKELVDLKADGTFRLNLRYFDYATGLKMTSSAFDRLFEGPPRSPESPLTQREMDLAASIQTVTEEIILRLGRTVHKELGVENLCLAGGVALNCVANGRLLREGPFKKIWIQPAAGDAGGAVGAALSVWHEYHGRPRIPRHGDAMNGGYLGPEFTNSEIRASLDSLGAIYQELPHEEVLEKTADALADKKVVGWFQGRMEFGPRALGNRSILGDPRNPEMQSIMNLKIKFRESFRPFAPAVLAEDCSRFFEFSAESPYMLQVAFLRPDLRRPVPENQKQPFGIELLKLNRSTLPAVTHVDYSARIQTVSRETNPPFHGLLEYFKKRTGQGVLVNTSFNVRGEPIVHSPEDAYRCFMRTGIDLLVIGDFMLTKPDQPSRKTDDSWQQEFQAD